MKINKANITQLNKYLKIFRDDLYPFLGGGNKGRKMDAIAKDIYKKKANALVTTGGSQSNHCRAVAVFAAMNKMQCTLVLHGNKDEFLHASGNAKIIRDTKVNVVFVEQPSFIGPTMDMAMETYLSEGLTPYYIYGGGHTFEGGKAYIDAILELQKYCQETNWYPDYIFHASGTGSTQSGILAGLDLVGWNTKVIGISVGRKQEQAEKVVDNFYRELCHYYNISSTEREVVVLDDYLCGGYEKFNSKIENISKNSLSQYGFTLDTCYTAKAFYGMQDVIEKKQLQNKNILFWHTGGIFNYLAG